MNLAAMQTALMRYGFDSTDPLNTWLNAALHEFEASFDWPFLEVGPVSITVNPGSNSIPLPSDALKIISIRDVTHLYKLKYYNRRRFESTISDQTETGFPEVYTLMNTNIVQFWRVNQDTTTFSVIYQAAVPDLANANDVPSTSEGGVFPVSCHYPIVMLAAVIGLQAENEEDRAKTAMEAYQRAVMVCMGKFGERELDEVDGVQDTQGYFSDMPYMGRGSGAGY